MSSPGKGWMRLVQKFSALILAPKKAHSSHLQWEHFWGSTWLLFTYSHTDALSYCTSIVYSHPAGCLKQECKHVNIHPLYLTRLAGDRFPWGPGEPGYWHCHLSLQPNWAIQNLLPGHPLALGLLRFFLEWMDIWHPTCNPNPSPPPSSGYVHCCSWVMG